MTLLRVAKDCYRRVRTRKGADVAARPGILRVVEEQHQREPTDAGVCVKPKDRVHNTKLRGKETRTADRADKVRVVVSAEGAASGRSEERRVGKDRKEGWG